MYGLEYRIPTRRQFGFPSSLGWSMRVPEEDASSPAMAGDDDSIELSMPNQLATNALQNLEGFQTAQASTLTQPFPRPIPKIPDLNEQIDFYEEDSLGLLVLILVREDATKFHTFGR